MRASTINETFDMIKNFRINYRNALPKIRGDATVRTERGFLEVKENWRRLACDVTHYQNRRYLTMIDCGPSRFSIWKVIASESAQELSNVVEGIFREMGPPCEMLLDNYSSFRSSLY